MDRITYDKMANVEDSHWWYRARRKIVHSILYRHLPKSQNVRILEIGCGTGGNISLLRNFGEVEAAEADSRARQVAQEKSGCKILPCHLPSDLPVEDRAYGLIVLLDVLEHIDEDLATLRSITKKLSRDGFVMLTVPALPWLWSRHDELSHHKRRYTKASLRNVTEKAGFAVVEVGYFNSLLLPLVALARLIKGLTNDKSLDNEMPHPVINRTLEAIFGFERHLLGWLKFPIGVSLYLIAQPNREAAAVATHSDSCQKEGQGLTAQASR